MLDHIVLVVKDLEASRRFYASCLAPLGYGVMHEYPGVLGMGVPPRPDFWLGAVEPSHERSAQPTTPIHLAFRAATRREVDAFYDAAMKEGGVDNGPPGLRPHYHPNYYGAFVLDPDGHNLEAVCHEPI